MEKCKITINNITVMAENDQTILEAALASDIYIPHICSHPDLEPQGGCKLCIVEIDGDESNPVTSCNTLVRNGMNIKTRSPVIDKLRNISMELILAGHPHDCTSCRSYLNCELQSIMQYMSVTGVRMRDVHRTTTHINTINPLIDREMERCIQCGRCVRACNDLRGVGVLDYKKSGSENYIGTKDDLPLSDADCRFCGACIEVCPTGALQDRKGVFRIDIPRNQALIPCQADCPAHLDIPGYVRYISEGLHSEAVALIREQVPFPHALGYVCTHPCQTVCKRTHLDKAVSIRDLKRVAVENDNIHLWKNKSRIKPSTGKNVAVVGSGPCGLTAAYYLAKAGHNVMVYERNGVAGGMMATGIPSYRLPRKDLQVEIDTILDAGVTLCLNHDVEDVNALKGEYDAVLVAVGSSAGKSIPVPGNALGCSMTAVDFLRDVALDNNVMLKEGQTVTVLGGGNVAFDAARVSRRLGANVNLVCLESRENILADLEEIEEAEEEGVKVFPGKSSLSIEGLSGKISGLKVIDVESFHFEKGELIVNTKPGTETILQTDAIIFAAGQKPDINASFGLELNKFGYPVCNAPHHDTSLDGVFLAGDIITGTKAVIDAIVAGKEAAQEIDLFLGGDGDISETLIERERPSPNIGKKTETPCESEMCLQCDLRNQIQKVALWNSYGNK